MNREISEQIIAILPRLRRFTGSLTRSAADADDLAQATVERAIERIEAWTPGTRLDSWLYRIAQNLHLNEVRRVKVRRLHQATTAPIEAVEGDAEARLELERVRIRIGALPAEQRQALLLIAVEGYGYAEAAAIVGVPVGTITSRLGRARPTLAEMGEEKGMAS